MAADATSQCTLEFAPLDAAAADRSRPYRARRFDPGLAPPVENARNAWISVANGVVGIALTQTVFNGVVKTLRSYEASVLAGSGVVWTALLAIPILGEWLEWRQVAAIAVVLFGVLLAQRRPEERAAD